MKELDQTDSAQVAGGILPLIIAAGGEIACGYLVAMGAYNTYITVTESRLPTVEEYVKR